MGILLSRTVSEKVVFALLVKMAHRFWLDQLLVSNWLKLPIVCPNFVHRYFYVGMCTKKQRSQPVSTTRTQYPCNS